MTPRQSGLDRNRAADGLVAAFERQILDGSLAEGDTLPPEREIVQRHGVSRTVVREAVLALSNKGLVEARPGFRPVVRKPGYDAAIQAVSSVALRLLSVPGGVRNLFGLRVMIEAGLARQAALSAKREHISRMRDALAKNEAAIEDSDAFYLTDMEFHQVIYEVPDNPLLPSIHRGFTDWLAMQWKEMPRRPERNRRNFEAHARIFDAILMRDPDAAESALRRHLDDAWQQVHQTFPEL